MLLLSIVGAYLMGSIPFGLIVARAVKRIDIREHGSKNIGATNVARVVGNKWGILVFALDVLKGILSVLLPRLWLTHDSSSILYLGFGAMAILGHTFPIWLLFRGGKGVATSLGVFLAFCWLPTLISFGIWLAIFSKTRIVSLASLFAAGLFPVFVFFFERSRSAFPWLLTLSLILALFIVMTHKENIRRLLRGEEESMK